MPFPESSVPGGLKRPFVLFYLRILDISFNVLRHIEGLDRLTQLKKLFLVNNKISKIENLSKLQMLQMLELGSNRIRVGSLYKMLAGELFALWFGISLFWKCASLTFTCDFVFIVLAIYCVIAYCCSCWIL